MNVVFIKRKSSSNIIILPKILTIKFYFCKVSEEISKKFGEVSLKKTLMLNKYERNYLF